MSTNKRKQITLDAFVKKIKNNEEQVASTGTSVCAFVPVQSGSGHREDSISLSIEPPIFKVDIGIYLREEREWTDTERYNFLKHAFVPDAGFEFPFSTHNKNNKIIKCYLSQKHFDTFKWLTFSKSMKGIFCKYCSVFAKFGGTNKVAPLGKLVRSPVNKYSKLFGKDGDLTIHDSHRYHKSSIEFALNFIETYENPQKNIINTMDSRRKEQIRENRERLKPIIESVIFLGRQNIPLRGHKDYGILNMSEQGCQETLNEGNFRELLRFRVSSGDTILKAHLESANSRATYISKNTQNEIIEVCGNIIIKKIINDIFQSEYFSIVFDETTDISHISQMSLVFGYMGQDDKIQEDFISFIDCREENFDESTSEPSLTGKILARTVLNFMNKYGLNLNNCVGIGTDTCSVMLSEQKGAVTELKKFLPNSMKCPCYSHSLNLSISKSSSVQDIRNSVGIMKEVIAFFNASSKRNIILKNTSQQLKKLCETRWTERHESVLRFKTNLVGIVESLQIISGWNDRESSSKALCLMNSLTTTNFIASIFCLSSILSITLNLSKILQKKSIDHHQASSLITDIISVLRQSRLEADLSFNSLYIDIMETHKLLNIPISLPRRVGKQINRANLQTNDPEEYYRITIYIPLLENVIEDLRFRFPDKFIKYLQYNQLIPANSLTKAADGDELQQLAQDIAENLAPILNEDKALLKIKLCSEISLWIMKWRNKEGSVPDNAVNAYSVCDADVFPLIKKSLKIISVLPVSVASAERSFSSLKRLKTWLRSSMNQDRLVGLALLNIHRNINLNADEVIDEFSKEKRRLTEFKI